MFVYEGHLSGGIYPSKKKLTSEELHCEVCGDSDWYIGEFNSAVEILKHLADDIDANDGHGGYMIDGVLEALQCFKDVPLLEEAISIVKSNRTEEEKEKENDFKKELEKHGLDANSFLDLCDVWNSLSSKEKLEILESEKENNND